MNGSSFLVNRDEFMQIIVTSKVEKIIQAATIEIMRIVIFHFDFPLPDIVL